MASKRLLSLVIVFAFLTNMIGPICPIALVQAQIPSIASKEYPLPAPGVMVHLSPEFNPPILKGIKVHADNPFRFDFILDKGDVETPSLESLRNESTKLIKYFLASLTIPEKDLWVNLSPYEKDRIIPASFGMTEMGRDLLAEDYMLKQITASLIYPEDAIGKRFWKRVYEQAAKKYGTTNIPINTFNKVWIVPQKAVVYENAKKGIAYVVGSKLKVMLEQDYLALEKNTIILSTAKVLNKINSIRDSSATPQNDVNALGSQIVREVVIPELTKEVNENKNFAKVRQVYNSLILATWYKKKIKDSILTQVYANKSKVAGININDPNEKERIYQQYLRAFKKGVYSFIKEEADPITQEIIPRKYFSGGFDLALLSNSTIEFSHDPAMILGQGTFLKDHALIVEAGVNAPDQAMQSDNWLETATEVSFIDLIKNVCTNNPTWLQSIDLTQANVNLKLTNLSVVPNEQKKEKRNEFTDLRMILKELISNALQGQNALLKHRKTGVIKVVVDKINNKISISNQGRLPWLKIRKKYLDLFKKGELYASHNTDGSINGFASEDYSLFPGYTLATQDEVYHLLGIIEKSKFEETPNGKIILRKLINKKILVEVASIETPSTESASTEVFLNPMFK
ncbi:MAG: hypothetical protein HQL12_09600, partial [Candidatus Omnitrophica bacterium]|nr:hypothetical protein [Candidatus Omnitrophota bacterium]